MSEKHCTSIAVSGKEIWKDVVGYEGLYQISNLGRIKALARTRPHRSRWGTIVVYKYKPIIRKPGTNSAYGHKFIPLYDQNGKGRNHSIHRLVLLAFVGPCPEGMEACHENGKPWDNRLENLRWDTHKENHQDRIRHGTNNAGEKHGHAKLTDAIVREIRERYDAGEKSWKMFAQEYGVHPNIIGCVVKRKSWKHVV